MSTPPVILASTPTPVYTSKFGSAVDKLDASRKPWVTFQWHFIITVKQKQVHGHFDGSSKKPSLLSPPTDDETKALNAWQEKEYTVMYLLSQKLAN
jgi:hypothetical protein